MADFCSCGAQLPADARFCHRCGKPQRADPPPEPEYHSEFEHPPGIEHSADDLRAIAAAAAPAEAPAAISFHNANAVRAGFFTAIIIWVLMIIPLGGLAGIFLKIFVLLGGGFLAVVFYSRRTGQLLTVAAGARLGWITGVLFYVIWVLFFTVTIVVLQDQGGLLEAYKKQLQEANAPRRYHQADHGHYAIPGSIRRHDAAHVRRYVCRLHAADDPGRRSSRESPGTRLVRSFTISTPAKMIAIAVISFFPNGSS